MDPGGRVLPGRVRVGGDHAELHLGALSAGHEERAVLRRDDRRDLGHDEARQLPQVALALHHAGDPGQVRLEPILLRALLRRLAEVADHLVDVVFQLGDLALRLDVDRAGQVALRDGRGHIGDGSDLCREVLRQLVHVLGQMTPGSGDVFDLGLTSELPLGPDLARHARHLGGEG